MTRPTKSKILYAVVLLVLIGLGVTVIKLFHFRPNTLVILALFYLIPGRVTSFFWREFYRGQELVKQRQYLQAKICFENFLRKIRSNPWIKKLIYFKWGIYTWEIEAMTLNNIGSISLELNDLEGAVQSFDAAIARDPQFPLPFANLAIVNYVRGNSDQGVQLLNHSHLLGCSLLDEQSAQKEAMTIRARLNAKEQN